MSPGLAALLAALIAGYVMWHWGRAAAPRDPSALRVLLGKDEPATSGPERERVAALESALVDVGWVHQNHVDDPEHYDRAGRYLWWGM